MIKHTVCPLDCADTCSLGVTIENDQITKVRGTSVNPFTDAATATSTGSALASMAIYILMGGVLIWRPTGLFGVRGA